MWPRRNFSTSSYLKKPLANNIAPMFTLIYQATLKQQMIPADWKKALVAPIFKKAGAHTCPANYRPISLTCIPCKIYIRAHHIQPYI